MPLLLNAFSLNMLSAEAAAVPLNIAVNPVSVEEVRRLLAEGFTSAIGHADTAALVSSILGVPVPFERRNVALNVGEGAVVAQYRGPRLPEGCRILPEGAVFEFFYVRVGG
jgi:hypothetical protein